jgi:hypothetical protein
MNYHFAPYPRNAAVPLQNILLLHDNNQSRIKGEPINFFAGRKATAI